MPKASWYVVFTRPNSEKKVVDNFLKKGIECYCPYKRVVGLSGNRKQVENKPLFASFVFVRIHSLKFDSIKRVDGVINLMYWFDKPAVIRDIEIEMMKRFLNEHDNVHAERTSVNVDEIVKIRNASLNNEEGDYSNKVRKVKMTLPSMGYSLVAEVPVIEVDVLVNEMALLKKGEMIGVETPALQNTMNFGA